MSSFEDEALSGCKSPEFEYNMIDEFGGLLSEQEYYNPEPQERPKKKLKHPREPRNQRTMNKALLVPLFLIY